MVEHLDPPRLALLEWVLFEFAKPQRAVLITPNREYNMARETFGAGRFRHPDHYFKWAPEEFPVWAEAVAGRFGYMVWFLSVGSDEEKPGSPTQMGVFTHV